jgi:RNA polymerase sigma factor (sigma-70 family)
VSESISRLDVRPYARPMAYGAHADESLDLVELVTRARNRDEEAWRLLCNRVKNVAWKVINNEGLRGPDADDAFAATFLRLAEKIDTIREPAKLPGWLATTALNECRALGRSRRRFDPRDDVPEPPDSGARPEDAVFDAEAHTAVAAAFGELPESCQRLLRLLTTDPPLAYDEISSLLDGMPVGSIGPTRARCLERLRRLLAVAGYGGGAS